MCMNREEELLRKEYELIHGLYKHEDNLCETRNTVFAVINVGILGMFKWLSTNLAVAGTPTWIDKWPHAICAIGILLSLMWLVVATQGKRYIKFRMRQAEKLERALGTLTTFTEEMKFYYTPVKNPKPGEYPWKTKQFALLGVYLYGGSIPFMFIAVWGYMLRQLLVAPG